MHGHDTPHFRFCPLCGAELWSRILKKNEPARLVCSKCAFVFYRDPKVVVCSVVEMEGKIVLLKRGIEPQLGKWGMPGGYVDQGEEVEAAALREAEEECGLKIRVKKLLGVYSYPGRVAVVVVYLSEHFSGQLIVGDETEEAKLWRPEEIPWNNLAFPSTVDALKDFCQMKDAC